MYPMVQQFSEHEWAVIPKHLVGQKGFAYGSLVICITPEEALKKWYEIEQLKAIAIDQKINACRALNDKRQKEMRAKRKAWRMKREELWKQPIITLEWLKAMCEPRLR